MCFLIWTTCWTWSEIHPSGAARGLSCCRKQKHPTWLVWSVRGCGIYRWRHLCLSGRWKNHKTKVPFSTTKTGAQVRNHMSFICDFRQWTTVVLPVEQHQMKGDFCTGGLWDQRAKLLNMNLPVWDYWLLDNGSSISHSWSKQGYFRQHAQHQQCLINLSGHCRRKCSSTDTVHCSSGGGHLCILGSSHFKISVT